MLVLASLCFQGQKEIEWATSVALLLTPNLGYRQRHVHALARSGSKASRAIAATAAQGCAASVAKPRAYFLSSTVSAPPFRRRFFWLGASLRHSLRGIRSDKNYACGSFRGRPRPRFGICRSSFSTCTSSSSCSTSKALLTGAPFLCRLARFWRAACYMECPARLCCCDRNRRKCGEGMATESLQGDAPEQAFCGSGRLLT